MNEPVDVWASRHQSRERPGLDRSIRALADCLARRARGPTLVCQTYGSGFAARMRERNQEITLVGRDPGTWPPGDGVQTVVLAGLLDGLSEDTWSNLLASAWSRLGPGGRLVVCGTNRSQDPHDEDGREGANRERPRWDRRRLEKALGRLGKPRLAGDQPYRWLTMWVQKPRTGPGSMPRTRKARYRVTARLCRGRVLELGCGDGHLAGMIAARGHEVVGVDLNRPKIEAARRRYPGVSFLTGDIGQLQLPEASFDTGVLAEVLEHVDEPTGARFLAIAWRLLRPGGRLVVSVPNEDCIPHRNHVRTFDRGILRAMLRPLGRPRLITDQPYQWLLMVVDKR